jgi:hypothetical protein
LSQFVLPRWLPVLLVCSLPISPALADTVVRPLPIAGNFATSPPHPRDDGAEADLGIAFAQISSVGLRIDGRALPGLARTVGSSYVEQFPPLATATLLRDNGSTAAFGELLFPHYNTYDQLIEIDDNWPPAGPDYSSLFDGKTSVKFSVNVPLMTAITTIEEYPAVEVRASALVVTGETLGRLAGDFDGDGTVFEQDLELFRRMFGQHVTPGTAADGNGNGVVDVADYVTWRDHIGASIRPTAGYLAGDFDYSGAVDFADYDFWRLRFKRHVAPFSGADGSGNGIVDAADYRVWRDQLGLSLPGYSLSTAQAPEPTSLLLAIACWCAIVVLRRH